MNESVPNARKADLIRRLNASTRALEGVNLGNMTQEHRRAASEYVYVVETLAREHAYGVCLSGVTSLKRALVR